MLSIAIGDLPSHFFREAIYSKDLELESLDYRISVRLSYITVDRADMRIERIYDIDA